MANWIQRFLTAIATHKADASAHHAKTVAGDLNLADLAEKAHGSLTGVTSDQHHAQAHTLASHSTKAHNELTGVTPDQHHTKLIATSGSYTGNGTVNRAIPHGLGVVPKVVLMYGGTVSSWFHMLHPSSANVHYQKAEEAGVSGARAVTAMNATNFYVGNSANYLESANDVGKDYYWVAFG